MNMISELIDRLRQRADILAKSGLMVDGVIKNYREAADTIQSLSEKLHASQMERSSQYYNGGWIPVDERVPVNDDLVLVYDGDGASMMVAWYDGDDGEWNDFNLGGFAIVYAKDTRVKYLIWYNTYEGGITPLYNADGSLQVYEEDE